MKTKIALLIIGLLLVGQATAGVFEGSMPSCDRAGQVLEIYHGLANDYQDHEYYLYDKKARADLQREIERNPALRSDALFRAFSNITLYAWATRSNPTGYVVEGFVQACYDNTEAEAFRQQNEEQQLWQLL